MNKKIIDKLEKKINLLSKNYYSPKNPKYFEKLRQKTITRLSDKEIEYLKHLKPKFKKLVVLRNQLAQVHKHKSYFNFVAELDAVPTKELNLFFKNVLSTSKKIINNLQINNSEWFDGKRYYFNLSTLCSKEKYKLPLDVKKVIVKHTDFEEKYFKKIEIIHSEQAISCAEYDYQNKKAKIYFNKKSNSPLDAANLAHEYGHVLGMLTEAHKNKETDYPKPYIDEKRAVKCELQFINSLNKKDKQIAKLRYLYDFSVTLFESEIYKNPNQDFGEVYIKVQNQLTGKKSKLKKDLSYLLNSFLIEYPCYSTNYSVNLTSFLSKR